MAPNKMPFKSHLGHLFHPLSRKSSQTDSSPGSTTTDNPSSTGRSKTASSCELFGIIKALAAGGGDAHDHDDLDTPGSLDMDSGDEREALENQMRDALAESDDRDILSSKFTGGLSMTPALTDSSLDGQHRALGIGVSATKGKPSSPSTVRVVQGRRIAGRNERGFYANAP